MSISIIIPTINRYHDLTNTVKYLKSQSVTDFEIIIIDQTDNEHFEDLSQLDIRVKHFHRPNFTSASKARNIGLKKSVNEIILFLDDDVILENDDFLAKHIRHYEQGASGVFGAVLDANNREWRTSRHRFSYWEKTGWLFFPPNFNKSTKVRNGGAGNLSIRREWAIEIGGMNEQYVKGAHREESDFCLRYTDKYGLLEFDPEAYLIHIGNRTGGIRSWNKNSVLKAQHNYDGAIYFIFQSVPLIEQPIHWAVTLRYFFSRQVLTNPRYLAISLFRFLKGIANGIKMKKKGPVYLEE